MVWVTVILAALCPAMVMSTAPWDHYVLVHNFMDTMAQSICTAISPNNRDRVVSAIRHNCARNTKLRCNDICKRQKMSCDDGIYVYKKPKVLRANQEIAQTDPHIRSLNVQRFKQPAGCRMQGCGPNYCCCYERARQIHGHQIP